APQASRHSELRTHRHSILAPKCEVFFHSGKIGFLGWSGYRTDILARHFIHNPGQTSIGLANFAPLKPLAGPAFFFRASRAGAAKRLVLQRATSLVQTVSRESLTGGRKDRFPHQAAQSLGREYFFRPYCRDKGPPERAGSVSDGLPS